MGFQEKILRAESSDWLTKEFSKAESKSAIELAKISGRLEMKRVEMGMTQKQFALFMGVSQAMVSKWESREYNFSITTLNEICEKLDMVFDPLIRDTDHCGYEQFADFNYKKSQIRAISKYALKQTGWKNRGIA